MLVFFMILQASWMQNHVSLMLWYNPSTYFSTLQQNFIALKKLFQSNWFSFIYWKALSTRSTTYCLTMRSYLASPCLSLLISEMMTYLKGLSWRSTWWVHLKLLTQCLKYYKLSKHFFYIILRHIIIWIVWKLFTIVPIALFLL